MNKKNTIRLTESDLKRVISESVKRVLREGKFENNRVPRDGYLYDDEETGEVTYFEPDPWFDEYNSPDAKKKRKDRFLNSPEWSQRRLWYDNICDSKNKNEVLGLLKNNYDSLIQEVEDDMFALQWWYAPEGRRISVHGDFEAWELNDGSYALIVRSGMEKKYLKM